MSELSRHPARSPEFLSRLHDGDLSAAERVQFEAHRAHCASCRDAAARFDAALALYRSNRPQPPAPDLSARILRRLQSHPRRSPFGVMFGIDLRWAGAFAAALIAVIIASSVVVEREAAERKLARERAPIPVVMQRNESAPQPIPTQTVAPRPVPPHAGANAPRTGALQRQSVSEKPFAMREAGPASAAPSAPSTPLRKDAAGAPKAGRLPAAAGQVSSSTLAVDAVSVRPRLEILAIDEVGAAPALVTEGAVDLPVELRGEEFILTVEADGRVSRVEPAGAGARAKVLDQPKPASSAAAAVSGNPLQALKDLRFQPGDRPRLLRVRVD